MKRKRSTPICVCVLLDTKSVMCKVQHRKGIEMELFSKIYNRYYEVVKRLLALAKQKGFVTKKDMMELAKKYGFEESSMFIVPKLVSGEWSFFQEKEKDIFVSKINATVKPPLTKLQKAWIKAWITDSRAKLFFSEEELKIVEEELKEIEPLYQIDDFYYFDQFKDGDHYKDIEYQKRFLLILRAMEQKNIVHIVYEKRKEKGNVSELDVMPIYLQYSIKDNKFRIEGIRIYQGKPQNAITLNLERIKVCYLGESFDVLNWNGIFCKNKRNHVLSEKEQNENEQQKEYSINLKKNLENQRAKEPVVIEISGERNSLERCMLHFASYQKKTEYNEEKKRYLCSIYYDKRDETELLIQVLSFGPVIKVIGHSDFLRQVRQRIEMQYQLNHKGL